MLCVVEGVPKPFRNLGAQQVFETREHHAPAKPSGRVDETPHDPLMSWHDMIFCLAVETSEDLPAACIQRGLEYLQVDSPYNLPLLAERRRSLLIA